MNACNCFQAITPAYYINEITTKCLLPNTFLINRDDGKIQKMAKTIFALLAAIPQLLVNACKWATEKFTPIPVQPDAGSFELKNISVSDIIAEKK